jgi:hypothetical protein
MAENKQIQSKEDIIIKLAEKEHGFLRNELAHLKDCQIKFLTFSVTATALIFGIIGRSSLYVAESFKSLHGNMWFIPLLVLLPAWWVFFDKATTITRIVGYFRQIEKIILKKVVVNNFLGWENALSKFRKQKIKITKTESQISFYWLITFFTFFFLSLPCLIMGWKGSQEYIRGIAVFFISISFFWNGYILWRLIGGKFSYDSNEKKWEKILDIVMPTTSDNMAEKTMSKL